MQMLSLHLLIASELQLSVYSNDGRNNQLFVDQLAIAECKSIDGVDKRIQSFINKNDFDVTKMVFVNNSFKMWFRVSLRDHLKVLHCSDGEKNASEIIKVWRKIFVIVCVILIIIVQSDHSSTIIIKYQSNDTMVRPGSKLFCNTTDGYPKPVIQWHLISGPANAALFYTINEDGQQLHMKQRAPPASQWKFNCSARSVLTVSERLLNKSVIFTIGIDFLMHLIG